MRPPLTALSGATLLAILSLAACGPDEDAPSPNAEAEPAVVAAAGEHPGRAVYQTRCASCHDGGGERAPPLSTLRMMSEQSLRFALSDAGVMAGQAAPLAARDREQLIGYLADRDDAGDWVANMTCPADRRAVDVSSPPAFAMFGGDLGSTRNLSAARAGLTRADMSALKPAWTIAFPQTTGMGAAPAIVGSTLFTTTGGAGRMLALDTATGCVKWAYPAGPSRSSTTFGEIAGRAAVLFSVAGGDVLALDAADGTLIWRAPGLPERGGGGHIRGALVLADDKVLVPVSASGVNAAADPTFECCVGHGALVALDAATGARVWEHHTMEDADYTGAVSATGVRQRGPSGAPIWSTPSVDLKRRRVYVTTGQNTSLPTTPTSDAIIAVDLDSGAGRVVFQALRDDVWHWGCGRPPATPNPNCPTGKDLNSRDFDFGGAVVLAELADGSDVLLAGQKSGDLWALDPDSGAVVWNRRVGSGTALGGNHWGVAVDGARVFLPISDPATARAGDAALVPGVYAFDIATGDPVWSFKAAPDCAPRRLAAAPVCAKIFGFSATPLVVDGALIAGTTDGRLYAFDAATGEVLFTHDTLGPQPTLNGVAGAGGAIDAHAIAAGAGLIVVGSGYGLFAQPAGNLLMAFKAGADGPGG